VTGERSNPDAIDAEQKIHALRQIPLFESLGFVELVKVLNILHIRRVKAGENVIKEGEASSRFFVILDGGAEIRRQGETVSELAPGDFFGEMGLIDDSPRSADVVTTEPTHLLVIHRDDFNTLLHDQLQLSQKVLWSFCRVLTIRLRDTNEALS
jgi:CRP-like cAMP-binding protein